MANASMKIPVPIQYLFKKTSKYSLNFSRSYISEKINIQNYIKRSPTSILEAIASTVKVDTTGPAYKFHDDPFLTPLSNLEKKKYALSKEAGRKAAQFIRDKYPDCFNHQPDDPIIKSFIPKISYDENSVDEAVVLTCIQNFQVSDSIKAYQACQNKNIELSSTTLQSLLELVSYFNTEDGIDPYWQEELITQNIFKTQRIMKTWKDRGVAEDLFESIKEAGAEPYCAIIRGMCNYYQTERAWQLYQESLEKNITLDIGTYNALFRVCLIQSDESQEKWNFIQNLLEKIVENKLTPNIGTLNSILECMSFMRTWNKTASLSLQVVKEFKHLNIEPSLGSYFYLIRIHQTHRNAGSSILGSILDHIRGKTFTVQDIKDTWFFFVAMESCKSWDLAQRIHEIMLTGDNYKLLGGSLSERTYYRSYLLQAVNGLPLIDFMKLYNQLTPYVYSPDSELIEEILRMFGVHDNLDELPRIWSDSISCGLANDERILELTLMVMNKHNLDTVEATFATRLANVAWDIWERIQRNKENPRIRKQVEWTGHMLGDCISTLARCGASDKAYLILKAVCDNPSLVLGQIPVETIQVLVDVSIKSEDCSKCLVAVQYAKECEYPEAIEMAKLVAKQQNLDQDVKSKLIYLFGDDII